MLNIDVKLFSELFDKKSQNVTVKREDNIRMTDKQGLNSKLQIIGRRLKIPKNIRTLARMIIPKKILTLETSSNVTIPNLSEKQKQSLRERYADPNTLLCKELSVDLELLKKYGYSVK